MMDFRGYTRGVCRQAQVGKVREKNCEREDLWWRGR